MKSQIFTIQLDYGSDFQKEVFSGLMEMFIKVTSYNMGDKHKKNNITYSIKDIEDEKEYKASQIPEKKNHIQVETREKEISNEETVTKIINYAHGLKYRGPQDENERGYNRGIDKVINTIENYIDTFSPHDV